MQAIMALLMNAAHYVGDPIDAPPSNVTRFYENTKISYNWTNGDRTAQIEYSYDSGSTTDGVLAPGTTYLPTGYTDATWGSRVFAVRHVDGIYSSDWVTGD